MQMCVYLYTSVHKIYQGNMILNHATTGDSLLMLGQIMMIATIYIIPIGLQW